VTSIGASAFRDCTGLTNVTMERSDTTIGENLMGNNAFSVAYLAGGAGTYTGTYAGAWTKSI